ncbi:MAG TPA: DUF4233 domain-containing protein [Pseudonocardiaceae bacterium]|jgi:hypothetical protein|nr:DUF4233 domain-containing protein [Pseudonocardiaceae bacterium]
MISEPDETTAGPAETVPDTASTEADKPDKDANGDSGDSGDQGSAAGGASAPPDPMKGFRGVMAGALVMEAITVALALFAVAQLYGGLNSTVGYLVGFDALALVLACGFLRYKWIAGVVLALQLVMVACIGAAVAVGIVGLLFLVVWVYLLWLRREVSRRMVPGQLPGQQLRKHS